MRPLYIYIYIYIYSPAEDQSNTALALLIELSEVTCLLLQDLQARGPLRASQPESASPPAPASAAQKAANVAAAAGRIQDLSTRKQQTQPRGLDYGSAETPYREKEAIAPTEAKEDNSEPVTEDNQPGAPAAHGKTGETNLSHSLEQRQSGQQDSHSTAGH